MQSTELILFENPFATVGERLSNNNDDNETARAKDIVPETKNKTLLHRETNKSRHCPPSGRDPRFRLTRIRGWNALKKKPRGIRETRESAFVTATNLHRA